MTTQHATTADGTRIAYDVSGAGPTLILLHGGGRDRQNWHEAGYVQRLAPRFTVITIDIRGNGESDKPIDPTNYTSDTLSSDVLAVADDCGVDQFQLWGFSYGGTIGRYLAAASPRVASFVMIGIAFGPAASGEFCARIETFAERWRPALEAQQRGESLEDVLSSEDRVAFSAENIPLTFAWLTAMLDYRAVEPEDLQCPTLWLVGTENNPAMGNVAAHENDLPANVQLHLASGLNHHQEFSMITQTLPPMLQFTRMHV